MARTLTQEDIDKLLALYNDGGFAEALEEIERYAADCAPSPALFLLRGAVLTSLEEFEDAVSSYMAVLQLRPDDWEALNNLGLVLKKLGRLDEAAACYRRALVVRPRHPEVLTRLGAIFELQQKVDKAAVCYETALAVTPEDADTHNNLALLYRRRGDFDDALEHLNAAISLKPDDPEIAANTATVLREMERFDEAAAILEPALKAWPNHLRALLQQGLLLKKRGNDAEALRCFRRALDLDPDCIDALLNAAEITLHTAGYSEAKPYIDRLLALDLSPAATSSLIHALAQVGLLRHAPLQIKYGDRSLTYAGLADYEGTRECLAVSHGAIPRKEILDLSTGEKFLTEEPGGLSAYLLELPRAEYVMPNIMISGDTLIGSNNGYPTLEYATGLPGVDVNGSGGAICFNIKRSTSRVDVPPGTGVLCTDMAYAGWLLGELPRLYLYKRYAPDMLIALHGFPSPYHLESLVMYWAKDRVMLVPDTARICSEKLVLSTPTLVHHALFPEGLKFVREGALRNLSKDVERTRSIYVSRSRLGPNSARTLVNEVEIEDRLRAEGFDIIHPQELTFMEQVEVFASARRILAPYGAALANGLFCDSSVAVCIIRTKPQPEFSRLFQWLGATQYAIAPRARRRAFSARLSTAMEFSVDMADIEKFLQATA